MLEFNVAQLEKSPIGTTRDYPIDEHVDIEGGKIHIKGLVRLTKTNRSILVNAALDTEISQECCRCLREFMCPLKVDFQEEFFPTLDVMSGLPLEIEDGEDSFIIDEHHVLDLTEAVRQYIVLNQPMKPLCQPDCAGISAKGTSSAP